MAYYAILDIISTIYHDYTWLNVVHIMCMFRTDLLSEASTYQLVYRSVVMIWELTGGKGWLIMMSWVSYLRSIMVTRDWMWYIYCFCRGEAHYLRQALTNGCIAALVMIWELTGGKGWLIMLSWISYLRSIMVTRDWMWYIFCVCSVSDDMGDNWR